MASVAIATVLAFVVPSVDGAPLGSSSMTQQSRDEAIAFIPYDKLGQETQAKISEVVSRPSIYRQLPITVTQSDPGMHVFLVRYPEIIVNMWQLMGVTKVKMERTSDYTFKASDGAGTVCDVQLVYGDRNTHVYYAQGSYEGPLLRKLIGGSCVIVLRSEYAQTEDEQVYVTNRLDMFLRLDSVGAEILAKTLHPLFGKSADHNFTESTRFLSQISQAAQTRVVGLQQLAGRLNNVSDPVRDRFTQLAAEVNLRESSRTAHDLERTVVSHSPHSPAVPVVLTDPLNDQAERLLDGFPARKSLQLRR
jgi:hypothetical protein